MQLIDSRETKVIKDIIDNHNPRLRDHGVGWHYSADADRSIKLILYYKYEQNAPRYDQNDYKDNDSRPLPQVANLPVMQTDEEILPTYGEVDNIQLFDKNLYNV